MGEDKVQEFAVAAGRDWSKLAGEYELPDYLLSRIEGHLRSTGPDQLAFSNWSRSARDAVKHSTKTEKYVLVGRNGLGRNLRSNRFTDPSQWQELTDAIFLCEIARGGSQVVRFVLFDVSDNDERATIVYRRDEIAALWGILQERSGSGTLWRGSVIEDAASLRGLDEDAFVFDQATFKRVMDQTVGFLSGDQANQLRSWGLSPKRGLVLHGPPGNGKTLLTRFCAKAALEAGINVVIIDGKRHSRFGLSLGEQLESAAGHGPAVLIFEDIDLHCPRREDRQLGGKVLDDSSGLAEILEFLDGTVATQGYTLLATTNYLDRLDPALARPGRLDEEIFVPLPDLSIRVAVLTKLLVDGPKGTVNTEAAAVALDGCSYAELAEVVRRYKIAVAFNRPGSASSLFDNAVREVIESHDSVQDEGEDGE